MKSKKSVISYLQNKRKQFQGGGLAKGLKWGTEGMGSMMGNASALGSSLVDAIDPGDEYGVQSTGGALGSGALKGAASMASLGPIGMGAGALVGGITGLIGNNKAKDAAETAKEHKKSLEWSQSLNNSQNILASYDTAGTSIKSLQAGGVVVSTPGLYNKDDYHYPSKYSFQQGGVMAGNGNLQPIGDSESFEVKGQDPNATDDVKVGNAYVDHNEVVKPSEEGLRIFSDTLKPPGSKLPFSKLAKQLEKQKTADETKFPEQNKRIEQKLEELFEVQQQMNGDNTGESTEEAMEPAGEENGEGFEQGDGSMFHNGGRLYPIEQGDHKMIGLNFKPKGKYAKTYHDITPASFGKLAPIGFGSRVMSRAGVSLSSPDAETMYTNKVGPIAGRYQTGGRLNMNFARPTYETAAEGLFEQPKGYKAELKTEPGHGPGAATFQVGGQRLMAQDATRNTLQKPLSRPVNQDNKSELKLITTPPEVTPYDELVNSYSPVNEKYLNTMDKNHGYSYADQDALKLKTGKFNRATVPKKLIDDAYSAATKVGIDPYVLYGMIGQESTFGGALDSTGKVHSKKNLISGWNLGEKYSPPHPLKYLADKKVPGVKASKHFHGYEYDITDADSLNNYLKSNPSIKAGYDKTMQSNSVPENFDQFEEAAKWIKTKGIEKYNPGDKKYKDSVLNSKKLLEQDPVFSNYVNEMKKSKKYQFGGLQQLINAEPNPKLQSPRTWGERMEPGLGRQHLGRVSRANIDNARKATNPMAAPVNGNTNFNPGMPSLGQYADLSLPGKGADINFGNMIKPTSPYFNPDKAKMEGKFEADKAGFTSQPSKSGINWGDAIAKGATLAPVFANMAAAKRLPPVAQTYLNRPVSLQKMNYADQDNALQQGLRTAQLAAQQNSVNPNAQQAGMGNAQAQYMNAQNQMRGDVNRQNSAIGNQQSMINAQILGQNNALLSQRAQGEQARASNMLALQSGNRADLSGKILGMTQEQNQKDLDKQKYNMFTAWLNQQGGGLADRQPWMQKMKKGGIIRKANRKLGKKA
jgi:hypothetical protein